MIIKGFRFGMLLQLAVGPVCIFIFQMASENGFFLAEAGVLAVVLVDGIYILAAIIGISSLIEKAGMESYLRYFGAAILLLFGLNIILEVFSIHMLPSFELINSSGLNGSFLKGFVLTASNPLTIIFWAGVFSAKVIDEKMEKKDIYVFALGALMSTFIFLSAVAGAGSLTHQFLSEDLMKILNIAVGVLLICFGLKMIWKIQVNKENGV